MYTFIAQRHSRVILAIIAISIFTPNILKADYFIGNGQPGIPGSWAFEAWPNATHTKPNINTGNIFLNPAYFTKSGFTGTTRDQFEVWAGASYGWAKPAPGTNISESRVSSPEIGLEYYYNVIVPHAAYGSPDYVTFWTSPELFVNFPNGDTNSSGYGAGGNQYSAGFSIDNYFQVGKFGITFDPVQFYYQAKNVNATDLGNGQSKNFRGGLYLTLAEVAAGYQCTDSLFLGLHHSYSYYNMASSDYPESREGKIGPALSYSGLWAKHKILLSANLNFDYYTTNNLNRSTSLAMWFVKFF